MAPGPNVTLAVAVGARTTRATRTSRAPPWWRTPRTRCRRAWSSSGTTRDALGVFADAAGHHELRCRAGRHRPHDATEPGVCVSTKRSGVGSTTSVDRGCVAASSTQVPGVPAPSRRTRDRCGRRRSHRRRAHRWPVCRLTAQARATAWPVPLRRRRRSRRASRRRPERARTRRCDARAPPGRRCRPGRARRSPGRGPRPRRSAHFVWTPLRPGRTRTGRPPHHGCRHRHRPT